ncbi:hypothetical protein JOS77_04525 [Chromobacterium haemolyticum]|nr:hypothetical protein JOS77_04525 [Chromobacterium haemolyticum]
MILDVRELALGKAMGYFERRAVLRIGLVSLILALISAPVAWLVASESAENEIVLLAMEESKRFLLHFDSNKLTADGLISNAKVAAAGLSGGLFDIAEIYDRPKWWPARRVYDG